MAPQPAPLPAYQREYAGDRYPGADRQRELRSKNYRYEPRDAEVRRHYQAQRVERESNPQGRLQAAPRPESVSQTNQAAPQRQPRDEVQRQSQEREKVQPRQQDSRERDRERDGDRERSGDHNQDRSR